MVSPQKAMRKKVDKLVDAAERLAAVQYQAGLYAAEPVKRQKVQVKVNKCWTEFRMAYETLIDDYAAAPGVIVRFTR